MKSKKLTAVYALIMDLPLSLVVTAIALKLGNNLNPEMYVRMSIVAYVLTFFINFLPVGKWGFDFAIKHSTPGTFKFGLLINLVISAVFVVILDLVMTGLGVLVFGHGTMIAFLFAVLAGFIPCYVPTLVISMLWNPVADGLSRKICNEPELQHN